MHHRFVAILALLCLALDGAGCASKSNKDYEEVLMPLQTGSVLQRRVLVRTDHEKKPTKKKQKKESPASKPDAEAETKPRATPVPEEESTPSADRFR
jgi:hypothetical protein